jgi:alkanesulfonate monooxygenase SsuD/methylene tetrahydromethanopterin reductase-like flavin-dependent oxidoreductase (luciferase family)
MDFSTMVLTMYVPAGADNAEADERILSIAIEQTLMAAELGFNPWFTEHHFRGPWHSNPIQFASYIAPQISPERYLGFGVLSVPFYNPVRLVESMNLLDQLTKGRALFGLGSGWAGAEPDAMGISADYHANSRAADDTLEIVQKLWNFQTGDEPLVYETPLYRGTIKRRVTPAPYRRARPTVIRTAGRDSSVVAAAQKGWPAFLGTFAAESSLEDQIRLYRQTLAASNHSAQVVEECLRWCTCDWLAVVVANSDEEAQALAAEARAEHLSFRDAYVAANGPMHGPVVKPKKEVSNQKAYAAGGDMIELIAGTPDTVAKRVQALADAGINHLLVRFLGEWPGKTRYISEQSMRLFSQHIAPRFRDTAPPKTLLPLAAE